MINCIKWRYLNNSKGKTLTGHTREVDCLAVLPNGVLASGSDDRTINLWYEISSFNEK